MSPQISKCVRGECWYSGVIHLWSRDTYRAQLANNLLGFRTFRIFRQQQALP